MKKNLLLIIIFMMFTPIVVNAKTWLEANTYDTSWFNPDTYSTTQTYKLTGYSGGKLAGLLHLVNEEGYTFSGKTIQIEVEDSTRSCLNATGSLYCIVLANGNEWVPLASHFDGIFDLRKNGNGARYGYQTINVSSLDSNIKFTESGTCKYLKDTGVETNNCSFAKFSRYYSINKAETSNGTFDVSSKAIANGSVRVDVYPDEGYRANVSILDSDNNYLKSCNIYESYGNYCNFTMPSEPVTVKVDFTKIPVDDIVVVEPGSRKYCHPIKGNGKEFGSEIVCGSEHFYVLSSNKDVIRMLAKYNLYTGISIYKEKLEEGQSCQSLAESKGGVVKSDAFYNAPGYCFYTINTVREDNRTLQSKDAKSAHWDEDLNYLYPQIGDVYISTSEKGITKSNTPVKENTLFYDYDIDESVNIQLEVNQFTNGIGITRPLYNYKNELMKMGYLVSDISLLPVSELNNIAKQLSNEELPLEEWGQNINISNASIQEITFGDLKPYIPKDYSWLYSTTYWNNTVFSNYVPNLPGNSYYVFTAEQGKLCGAGFQACAPSTTLGCGVRPVITIPNELHYLIKTETDGHGTIEVVDNALGNDTIQFKATSNKGYKLKSIVIKTDGGETVKFDEGEIIDNGDGTYSVDKNKFTMPFENVTIQARWGLDILNPKTGMFYYTIVIMLLIVGISTYIYKKKNLKNRI